MLCAFYFHSSKYQLIMNTNDFFIKVKEIAGVETTEKFFGLNDYIHDTCPFIDKAKKIVKNIEREVNTNSRWSEEDYKNAVEYTESYISDIDTELEDLRSLNENLRKWGQSWKTFAKEEMKRMMEKDLDLFLSAAYYLDIDLNDEQIAKIKSLLSE